MTTAMSLWIEDETSRANMLKNLPNVRIKYEGETTTIKTLDVLSTLAKAVAYDVEISYTTYDSPRANCRDGYVYHELCNLGTVKELVVSNQDSDSDDYAYGYSIAIIPIHRNTIEAKIAELQALLV